MVTSSPVDHREDADAGDDLLVVEALSVSVQDGARTAVRDVSLTVRRGETVGLVGESGSGKTLTCRAVLGVLPDRCHVESGRLQFDGIRLDQLGRRRWEQVHGSRIGAVFQDPASYLNPSLTVGHQLAEVLRVRGGLDKRAAHARSIELFNAVGLHHPQRVWGQYPVE